MNYSPPEKCIPKSASGRYLQFAKCSGLLAVASSGPLAEVATASGSLADFGINFSGGIHIRGSFSRKHPKGMRDWTASSIFYFMAIYRIG